jgi:hypothetical protein
MLTHVLVLLLIRGSLSSLLLLDGLETVVGFENLLVFDLLLSEGWQVIAPINRI